MTVLHRVFWSSWCLLIAIALWLIPPVLAVSNNSSLDLFNSGLDNIRQQNYQQALVDLTKVIDSDNNLVGATYSNRCLVNLQLQRYNFAKSDCLAALEYNLDNQEAYLNLGLSYYYLEEYQQAIVQYQQIIKRDRTDYRAYYNLGLAHFALEDYQQAESDYNSALMFSEGISKEQQSSFYNERGITRMMLTNYTLAIVDLNRAIQLKASNDSAYFYLGCVDHRQGNYLAAIDNFTQAVKLNSSLTQAYVNRAILHHQLRHEGAAFKDLDKALQQYQQQDDRTAYEQVLTLKQIIIQSQVTQIA